MKRQKGSLPVSTDPIQERFRHLERLIGNTPMLALNYRYKGKPGRIYVKCEHYSLTGSVKDRMVLYILKKAYQKGAILPTDTLVEASSGNTGIALAARSEEHTSELQSLMRIS